MHGHWHAVMQIGGGQQIAVAVIQETATPSGGVRGSLHIASVGDIFLVFFGDLTERA